MPVSRIYSSSGKKGVVKGNINNKTEPANTCKQVYPSVLPKYYFAATISLTRFCNPNHVLYPGSFYQLLTPSTT
jgi:hypothetical protein